MKKFILAILLACAGVSVNAQNIFEMKYDQPFTDYVESEVPGQTAAQLYLNTLKWITTDHSGIIVHGSNHEMDKSVTLEVEYPDLLALNSLGSKATYRTKYNVKVDFVDNKFKFDYLSLQYYHPTQGKWMEYNINDKNLYNKKGELRSMNKFLTDIPVAINKLFSDLDKYLKDNKL